MRLILEVDSHDKKQKFSKCFLGGISDAWIRITLMQNRNLGPSPDSTKIGRRCQICFFVLNTPSKLMYGRHLTIFHTDKIEQF